MKKLFLFLALCSAPFLAFSEQGFYIQLQGNKVFVQDTDVSVTDSIGGVSATLSGEAEYDDSFTLGVEVGIKGIADTNFRAAIQFMQPKFEFKKATGGTLNYDGVDYSVAGELRRSDLEPQDIIDADAKMLMINGYYDFAGHWETFVPFVGVGVGMVDFDRASGKEAAVAAMLGFKKYITDSKQLYIGHKSSFTRVNGPTVSGVSFDDVNFYTATFQLGYEF
jgi:hypothetical protein